MVAVGACLSKPGNGGKCDADGNGCTADACIEGKCVVGGPVPCPPPLNPCKDAVCASTGPDAHDCVDVPSALGTPCEDGLFCTKESSCDGGGGCVGGKTVDCSQLSGGCIGGMCNEALDKCEGQPVLDGTPCEDDQLVCTKDACTAGMCGHAMTAGTCLIEGSCRADGEKPAGNPCKVCSSKDSPFAWWSVAQGTACADNLACTSETVCQANGVCGGGKQVSPQQCADLLGNKNPCLVGACVEPQGCMLKPGQDGAACSAANALVAVCVGGDCKVSECKPGYGNCDGSSANGCEADVAGSVANCGGCGKACQAGGKYAHAAVACVASKCVFQGCLEGFQDINGDCAGAGPCTDGCEEGVCVPIVDGTVEIPDDGKDNDCQGGDAGNEEAEGYYVDINFPFGDGCAKPGLGTRSCPFQYVWSALVACQFEQDWSQPTKVKREIYVAKGDYVEIGTVADVSKPVVVAGGYERTLEGPWKRDWTKHVTLLKSNSGMAVIAAPDVPGWAVFDGLGITQQVNVLGRLVLRHVNKVGQAPALKVAADADKAVLELLESSVSGDVSGGNADKWVLDGNKIGGSVKCNSAANDWVVNSNVIGGDLAPGSSATGWKAKGNVIQGTYSCPYCSTWELEGNEFQKEMTVNYAHDWKVAGNTFHAKINAYSCSNWTLTGNTFEGILSGSSSTWKLTGNTLKAGVSAGNSWIMRNNIVMGPVAGDGQWQLVNNTFFALPGQAGAWVTMNGAQWAIVNNAFVWNGSQAEGYYALKEAGANADPKIVRGNAFINFDGANGGFLLNEGTTPVTNIVLLNNSSELPSCGRGDNLAYDDVAAVAFASVDPSSKDFLKLTAGSTGLIDKGDALPSVCESVKVEASVVDLAGNKVPCGAKPDIGAYEFCGP
jgi:hypothetical protein